MTDSFLSLCNLGEYSPWISVLCGAVFKGFGLFLHKHQSDNSFSKKIQILSFHVSTLSNKKFKLRVLFKKITMMFLSFLYYYTNKTLERYTCKQKYIFCFWIHDRFFLFTLDCYIELFSQTAIDFLVEIYFIPH